MATLLSASQPPSSTKSEGSQPAILSPDGKKRYFIVHGGLFSKDGVTLDDVKKIDRYGKQPGQEGLMCELLWTDPQDAPGRGPSKRGVGVGFGPDVTKRWCEANQVTAVIRSHEVRQNGYAIEHGESAVARNRYVEEKLVLTRTFCTDGLCITTFSCPNYCDSTGNKASSPNFLHGLHVLTLARLCLSTGRLRPDAGRRSIVIPSIRRRASPGYPTDGVQRRFPGNGHVDIRLRRGGYQDKRCMPSIMTHRLGM
jgi:diadenosine tetraphosphatase ApaH/serine/threonine PP2A family protein phosphatase